MRLNKVRSKLLRHALLGIGAGLFVATGFSVWVVVVYLTSGSAPFQEVGVDGPDNLIAIYYIGFSLGGLLSGLLLRFRKSPVGSGFLGFLFFLPMYIGVALPQTPRSEWFEPTGLPLAVGIAIVVGGALGLWEWSDQRKR